MEFGFLLDGVGVDERGVQEGWSWAWKWLAFEARPEESVSRHAPRRGRRKRDGRQAARASRRKFSRAGKDVMLLLTSAALRDGALKLSKCFRRTGKEMAYTMTSLSNVGRGIRVVFLGAAAPRGCLAAARPRYAGRMD